MTISKAVLTVGAGILMTATAAQGQATQHRPGSWEIRSANGGFVPTGELRGALKNANLSGAQLTWNVNKAVAVTGTFSWAASRDVASANSPKLDVFTSDVGVELCPKQWGSATGTSFSTFTVMGAGARSYNYRKLHVDATHNLAGYAGLGAELGVRRFGFRLEARDYVSGFKPLMGAGTAQTRNDVVILAGIRYNRKQS
jgi:hypothetical protein